MEKPIRVIKQAAYQFRQASLRVFRRAKTRPDLPKQTLTKSLYDSASLLTIATAILYFWGTANIAGDAVALNLPASLLQRDLWSTLSYGAEGLISSTLLLHFSPIPSIPAAFISKALIAFAAGTALVYFAFRRSAFQRLAWRLWAAVVMSLYISANSTLGAARKIETLNGCIAKYQCDETNSLARIAVETKKEEIEKWEGAIMYSGSKNLVILTASGNVLIPIENIKYIETISIAALRAP